MINLYEYDSESGTKFEVKYKIIDYKSETKFDILKSFYNMKVERDKDYVI